MDDTNKLAVLDEVERDTPNVLDRNFDDYSDGIDWDEIERTTQPDYDAGRFAFDSSDYPTQEAAEAAMWELIQSIGRQVRERQAARRAVDPLRVLREQFEGPLRAPLIHASEYDASRLLADWRWLVPEAATPLFISALGDWLFGHPDGSLWLLSVLEGSYSEIAKSATEYNTLNKSGEWLEKTFLADWQIIAAANGMQPGKDECLGWRIHPVLGGKFEVANLQVFNMAVYQSMMGHLHSRIAGLRGQVDGCSFPRTMPIVETFINRSITMATVNFSVPDEVKAEFDRVFGDQNKSAIIAELMRTAVAEAKRRKQRESIFRTLTQRRADRPARTDKQIRASRTAGRS